MRPASTAAAVVVLGFVASRIVYFALGVRFDDEPLQSFWQYIDPQLLREDLLTSVWNFHAQPPVYNLFLGLGLKLGGDDARTVFAIAHALIGLAGTLALFALVMRLGASPRLAAFVSLLFFASPAAVLYENWLYVEHVVVVALIAAALCLNLFASGRGVRYAAAAFGALALVVLVRTMFHPVWMLAVIALVWLMQPGRRREVLVAAAVPLLLVGLVQAKAFVQFGSTSMTSCTGLSVFRVTTAWVPYDERRALVAEGVASSYALENPIFLPTIRPDRFRAEPRRGVAVLDRPLKSNGHVNVGHAAYLDLCPQYSRDGLKIARERPRVVGRGLQKGFEIYWRPASQYAVFDRRNRDSVEEIERASALALGQLDRDPDSADFSVQAQLDEIAWLLLLGYLLVFVLGARRLMAIRRGGGRPSPEAVVVAFVLFTIAFVTVSGNLLESGENNRFHYVLDPLVLALLTGWAVRWRERRRRTSPAGKE